MEKDLMLEQQAVVKFLFKLSKNATQTINILVVQTDSVWRIFYWESSYLQVDDGVLDGSKSIEND